MLTIRLAGRPLWLRPGTTLNVEYNSPLFSQEGLRGSFSYSFTLPLNGPNREVFGYPELIESTANLRRVFDECEIEDTGYLVGQRGQLRIRSVSPGTRSAPPTVSVTVGFGLSAAAADVRQRQLPSFALGGPRDVPFLVERFGGQVPGIVAHANDVVNAPENYDYVFGPVLNHAGELAPTATSIGVPPTLLNPWFIFDGDPFNLGQVAGSFLYYQRIDIPGAINPIGSPLPYAPFPRLSYVLRRLFQELGFTVRSDCFAGELGQLVVLHGNTVGGTFRLADLLPALSVSELLQKLRAGLGLVAELGPDGQVDLLTLQQVLDSREVEDWSHLAAPGFLARDVEEVAGTTLTYHVVSDDKQAATFFQGPPAGVPVADPVATVADLPVADFSNPLFPPTDQVRLVTTLNGYYRQLVSVDTDQMLTTARWVPAGSQYVPVPVAGGGDEQAQGLAATVVEETLLPSIQAGDDFALVPGLTEPDFLATGGERSGELRLAFYRGRQPLRGQPAATYPLLTPFHQDANGAPVGAYSLQLHGPQGTVARLLGPWLELLAAATPVKHVFYLTPQHLARLRFGRKISVHGNVYLIRQVQVTLPLQKGADVTLIPLPRG